MPQKTQHSFISSNPKKGQHISGQDRGQWLIFGYPKRMGRERKIKKQNFCR